MLWKEGDRKEEERGGARSGISHCQEVAGQRELVLWSQPVQHVHFYMASCFSPDLSCHLDGIPEMLHKNQVFLNQRWARGAVKNVRADGISQSWDY
jgi:hypothetical protein